MVAFKGVATQVRVRLQGSPYQRMVGRDIGTAWPGMAAGVGPSKGILKGWSYKLSLPNYARINGRSNIVLNKAQQGCGFYSAPLFNSLADASGIGNSKVGFARLHMNGYFLRYHMILTNQDDLDYHLELNEDRCWKQISQREGHYFKAQGVSSDMGPIGFADMRFGLFFLSLECLSLNYFVVFIVSVLNPTFTCPQYTQLDRYAATYQRKTYNSFGDAQGIKVALSLLPLFIKFMELMFSIE